jgi:hypothetical protein
MPYLAKCRVSNPDIQMPKIREFLGKNGALRVELTEIPTGMGSAGFLIETEFQNRKIASSFSSNFGGHIHLSSKNQQLSAPYRVVCWWQFSPPHQHWHRSSGYVPPVHAFAPDLDEMRKALEWCKSSVASLNMFPEHWLILEADFKDLTSAMRFAVLYDGSMYRLRRFRRRGRFDPIEIH